MAPYFFPQEGKAVSRPPQRACELPPLSAAQDPLSPPPFSSSAAPGSAGTASGRFCMCMLLLGRLDAWLCWAHVCDVGTVQEHGCAHDVWALAGHFVVTPCICLLYGRRVECGGISGGSAEIASLGVARHPELPNVIGWPAGTALAIGVLIINIVNGPCDPVSTWAGSP